jgi:non-specific serine/threonine protein kinase
MLGGRAVGEAESARIVHAKGRAQVDARHALCFAELLRDFRQRAGMSQEDLAERAALSRRGISDLERGARRFPRLETVRRLCEALQLEHAERVTLLAAARNLAAVETSQADLEVAAQRLGPRLPVPLSSFVGRSDDLAGLAQLLRKRRLVTLTGPGGVGKTRLALEVATRTSGEYPGGVWFVDLAPLRDHTLVLQTVAGALGVRLRPAPVNDPPADLLDLFAASLAGRRALLVLDNCEHLIAATARVADGLLQSLSTLVVLATSREALRIAGETVWRVRVLSVPGRLPVIADDIASDEAVQLFVERAGAADREFRLTAATAPAVAHICRRLDGIPLAIELAASRVAGLSVQDIAARLDHGLRLLTSGSRTTSVRHATMRDALEWSYDLLAPAEQSLFDRLSVFVGSFSLRAAESVCSGTGLDAFEVADLLSRLVARSVVQLERHEAGARYRMLETIHAFACDRTPVDEVELLRLRHAEYFLETAERAELELRGPDKTHWLDELESDHDNLRAALRWATDGPHPEVALRLAAAAWRFWVSRGYFIEADYWLRIVLDLPDSDLPARRAVLFAAGATALARASIPTAETLFRELLEQSDASGDEMWRAAAQTQLGFIASSRGHLSEAAERHALALAIRRSSGLQHGVVISLQALGGVAFDRGDGAQARRLCEEGVRLARELGDGLGVANCLKSLARGAVVDEDFGRARALLGEAVDVARTLRDPQLVVGLLRTWSELAQAVGDAEHAIRISAGLTRLRQMIGTDGSGTSPSVEFGTTTGTWTPADWALVEEMIEQALRWRHRA